MLWCTLLINPSLLRLNVGFIVGQSIGYSRDFSIEIPELSFSDEFVVHNFVGNVLVSRTTEGLLVQVKGKAQTEFECVYCLDAFDHTLRLDFVEMYTFPSHVVENTELILPDDQQIDLQPLLREYLTLEIPISPVCKPDCKGLCPVCGENQNQTTCNHDDDHRDPRLAVLKLLLDDDTSDEISPAS
jgi:uncharacterized protein